MNILFPGKLFFQIKKKKLKIANKGEHKNSSLLFVNSEPNSVEICSLYVTCLFFYLEKKIFKTS